MTYSHAIASLALTGGSACLGLAVYDRLKAIGHSRRNRSVAALSVTIFLVALSLFGVKTLIKNEEVSKLRKEASELSHDFRRFQQNLNRDTNRMIEWQRKRWQHAQTLPDKDAAFHEMTEEIREMMERQQEELSPLRIRSLDLRNKMIPYLSFEAQKALQDKDKEVEPMLKYAAIAGPHPARDLAEYFEWLARSISE